MVDVWLTDFSKFIAVLIAMADTGYWTNDEHILILVYAKKIYWFRRTNEG